MASRARRIDRLSSTARRVLAVTTAVVLAGCVSTQPVDEESSVRPDTVSDSTTETATDSDTDTVTDGDPDPSGGPTTVDDAPGGASGRTTTIAPDAEGLPSLSDLDDRTLTGTLDNGLRYLIRENDNPGAKAEMRLVVDAGSGLEDDTQIGGAHFLEHMLFNGTERFPKNELIDVLRSFGAGFGADINAYTSFDETVYQLTVPANDPSVVETGLDVLEQWLSHATIAEDDVVAERGIVLDEWRVRDQTADGRLLVEIADLFLAGTVYDGHLPIGGEDAIRATEPEPLRRFYDDWYRPDNAAVIVVGDIDVDAIEDAIIERFESATPRGSSPERPELTVDPSTEPKVRVVSDPDLVEGYAFVTLPVAASPGPSIEADLQASLYRQMAFDIVATRLNDDALRGEAPFDSAEVANSEFVRSLVAPEIYVRVDGGDIADAVQAIVDEYERVVRFGFTSEEVARAVGAVRSVAQTTFDGRESRQDASFADEYVDHVLLDEPFVDAETEFAFISEVLDRARPENLAYVFVEHVEASAPHVFAAVTDEDAADAPSEDEVLAIVSSVGDRDLEPRTGGVSIGDELLEQPDPIEPTAVAPLADRPFPNFIDPTLVTFPNGVRVAFNTNTIVEGRVFFEARSPGGLAAVADEDVPDADAAATVVADSGLGEFDRVSLDAFLDGKDVSLSGYIAPFEEGLFGDVATSDLDVLFQMIHLTMTAPRVDPVALEQYLDRELAFASQPDLDASYAEFLALRDARYDDIRFLLPTPETLATVDAEGIVDVAVDRFGDAGDWTFSFSGDFTLDDAIELAGSYLATLPTTDRVEVTGYAEEPPPEGVVQVETFAGQGDTANVSFLFTAAASTDRFDDVLARVVQEVVNNRLTDVVREELGDSYSPFGQLSIGSGSEPSSEFYLSVSTAPDQVDEVSDAVTEQLARLRADGPSEREFENAVATVSEQLNFFNNGQINDEVLDVLVGEAGIADFDDFLDELDIVSTVTLDDVRTGLSRWAPADRYIEVRVLPRT